MTGQLVWAGRRTRWDSATMCSRSLGRSPSAPRRARVRSAAGLAAAAFDAWSKNVISHPMTLRGRAWSNRPDATAPPASARAIARFFGNSSPKSICIEASRTAALRQRPQCPAPTAVGTPTPPNMVPSELADQRLGRVADQQAGDGDAQLGAGQHERRAPGDLQVLDVADVRRRTPSATPAAGTGPRPCRRTPAPRSTRWPP